MNQLQNAELTLSSLEVAEMLPKRHDHLMRDIDVYSNYLVAPKIGGNDFWKESTYVDKIGRILKCYQITKKGCEFIAHKMTGKKGAIFTATYINRFHEMEEQLKHPQPMEKLKFTMWKRCKVMPVRDLALISGLSASRINWGLKKYNLFYYMLEGKNLKKYKEENNVNTCAAWVILIPCGDVIQLMKKFDMWTKELEYELGEYFRPENAVVPVKQEVLPLKEPEPAIVSIRTAENIEKIKQFKKKLTSVECMMDELIGFKREMSEHTIYCKFIIDLIFGISVDMHDFRKSLTQK